MWSRVKHDKRDALTDIILPIFIGIIIVAVVQITQCNQTENLAKSNQRLSENLEKSNQRLLTLQIFSTMLKSNVNVYEKRMVDKFLDTIEDTNLAHRLKNISDLTFVDFYQDSVLSESREQRKNVIQEFAKIYKRLPDTVISIIKKEVTPEKYMIKKDYMKKYINNWPLAISVTKFFDYIDKYGDGEWYGTKDDSVLFANFKKSIYYDPNKDSTIYPYVNTMLANFRRK